MNRSILAVAVTSVVFAFSAMAAEPAKNSGKKHGKDNVIWPADQIKWEDGPVPGTKVAKLWGDWTKAGPYGVLIKFDAGVKHDLHHHTQTLKTVIISGTFTFQPEGGDETRLGPGSYLLQVGGKKHVSGCSAEAECEFFMMSNDKFDMIAEKPKAEKK